MPRLLSLIVLGVLIGCLGLAFFRVMEPFLLPLFLAAMLAILLQPVFRYCLAKTGQRKSLAAALTTFAALAMILIPVLLGTVLGALQLYHWASANIGSPEWEQGFQRVQDELDLEHLVARLQPYSSEALTVDKLRDQIRGNLQTAALYVAQRTLGVAATTFGLLGTIVAGAMSATVMLLALYFFLADGSAFMAAAEKLVPLDRRYQLQIFERFVSVVQAVVTATFAAACVQGLATAIALAFCGYGHQFFLLAILGTLTALIPLAGTWIVWGPCVLGMMWEGHWTSATILALYGILFVGTLDNLVRAYVLNSDVKLHPLLALVSVLGGLQWMGLWGIFVGPIVASCLHALIEIFNTELQALARSQTPVTPVEDLAPAPAVISSSSAPARAAVDAPRVVDTSPKPAPPGRNPRNKRRKR